VVRAAAGTLRRLPRVALAAPPRVALAIPPRARRWAIVAVLLAIMLFSVYKLWFRNSSFVSVQHVTVSGLTTSDAPRIRAALAAAAHDMSTLDVNQATLQSAVAGFPIVKDVVAKPAFPHTLRIRVIEEEPAALLVVGGERLLLAGDGSVLRGVATGHPLPVIHSSGSVPDATLKRGAAAAELRVVAAAPAPLAGRMTAVSEGKRGLYASLRDGPQIFFGDTGRLDAKWAAAAAVLADPSSKGASYVDVRLPERPVAGGLDAQTLAPLTATGSDASAQSNNSSAQSSAQPVASPAQVAGATGATGASGAAPNSQP
jgi:cell division protein FtsQ